MNNDGSKTGQVSLANRSTDIPSSGNAGLAEESGGGSLYIVDGSTQIQILDSYIEDSSDWGDGSFKSVAIAVSNLNDNGTSSNSDDYYQLAVKNTGSYTDWEGNSESYEDWQIYAIDKSGYVDWGKTIWTESIQPYEVALNADLDGQDGIGLNVSSLNTSSWTSNSKTISDTGDWVLKKDSTNSLYITNAAGDSSSLITLSQEWGGAAIFDYTDNYGYGSRSSTALAA